jgi:hypothetical protein
MKRIVLLTFVSFLFCISAYGNSENPNEPAGSELKGPGASEAPPLPPVGLPPGGPGGSEQRTIEPAIGSIFFAAGTVSADDRYLYVIFDRFLLQYALPALDLKRKVNLDIASAPVTPSISISKSSEWLYVISNGMLYQIDAKSLKIEKRIKITP